MIWVLVSKTFVGGEKLWIQNNAVNLVICQKSKIDDWVDHFNTYYPEYHVLNLTKKSQSITFRNEVAAMKTYDDSEQADVIGVINYELAFRRSWIAELENFTLLLDESGLIQNEGAKRSAFILKLHPESVILLSGTPTSGKYERLWSQLSLLGWNISKKAFWHSYVDTKWLEDDEGYKHEVIVGYKNTEHMMKRLKQFGAVFMKTEEVIDLPEQIEQMVMLDKTKQYKTFCKNNYLMMPDGTELVGDNTLTRMLRERQLCGQYHKEKLEAFKDLLQSTYDRVIVFYNFSAELAELQSIAEECDRPISFINGELKFLNNYEEYENSVTFIQYQAGAMGGNFQKANKIIYFTLPLGKGSCDLWEQSKKRIHRIGQNRTCFYYYLLVKDSIETYNLEMLRLGKDLTDELFKEH